MTETQPFELFVKNVYPYHYRKLKAAKRAIKLSLLKGAFAAVVFFGAPLSAALWFARIFIESHASSLQDGQKPLPYLQFLQPATEVAILVTLSICLICGAIQGYFRNCRLGLQIETDESKLRTEYLLREIASRESQEQDSSKSNDENIVLRNPKGPGSSQSKRHASERFTEVEDLELEPGVSFPSENPRAVRSISQAARVTTGPG